MKISNFCTSLNISTKMDCKYNNHVINFSSVAINIIFTREKSHLIEKAIIWAVLLQSTHEGRSPTVKSIYSWNILAHM